MVRQIAARERELRKTGKLSNILILVSCVRDVLQNSHIKSQSMVFNTCRAPIIKVNQGGAVCNQCILRGIK